MRVKHLFYVIALTAAATQIFGLGGILIAAGISVGWAYVFSKNDETVLRSRLGRLLIAVILLFLLGLLLLPAIQLPREVARRMQCRNTVRMLCLALQNYESSYGSFPPAITRDVDGTSRSVARAIQTGSH